MGQGYDVNSSQTMRCPTVDEYIRTIDGSKFCFVPAATLNMSSDLVYSETGGLLELNARLLVLKAKTEVSYDTIRRMVVLFGRYYQLRDDYTSVQSPTTVCYA